MLRVQEYMCKNTRKENKQPPTHCVETKVLHWIEAHLTTVWLDGSCYPA